MTSFNKKQFFFLTRFFLYCLLLLTVSRLLLVSWQWDRVQDLSVLTRIMWGGLRIDLSLICGLLIFPALLILVTNLVPILNKFSHRAIGIYCWIWGLLLVLMEVASPTFINEYDTRPNRLFFEYLESPKEVVGMLFNGYLLAVSLSLLIIIVAAWLTRHWLKRKPLEITAKFNFLGLLAYSGLTLLLIIGIRSGFQHRPINPAMVAFSQDRMINSLPLNSTYSVLYAIYQLKNEASASQIYGELAEKEMVDLIRSRMPLQAQFVDPNIPTLHTKSSSFKPDKKNLIIVVEESLGAQFVGSLGGKPLTPNIDKWRDKSWFFNKLYATGTRSARGLEAITTGFLPSPARAVLKLPKAQHGFYNIAQTLAGVGYETSFIYGGESHFDNMKGFFLANGFSRVIDQNNYLNPQFKGNWGVSDEDLFDNALQYLQQPSQRPKFSLIFTSSNHTPFEFPDNKIALYDEEKQTVNNAVKYADYALGQFLEQLEASGLLQSSVVLVVADHDARVFGAELVPVSNFHVPGFILSPDIEPHVDQTLVSHIDLAPTLLSLLGIESETPMIGQDLSQLPGNYQGRAIMQYGNNQAYWQGDQLVVMQPDKAAIQYRYQDGQYQPSSRKDLIKLALAHAQYASWAYSSQKYRLMDKAVISTSLHFKRRKGH